MKTKNYFLALLFISIAAGIQAQSYIGFGFLATTPQGEMKKSGYGTGGGLNLEIATTPIAGFSGTTIETRLVGTLDLQCLGYSKKIEDVIMPTPNNDKGYVYFENTAVGFSIGPRFSVNTGTRFTPYAGVFATYRLYSSFRHNTLYDEKKQDDLKENEKNVYTAGRLQTGISGGVMFRIGKRTSIDFRMSYAYGTGVQFVNLYDAWKDEDATIRYRMDKSRTSNLLTTQLGMQFSF